MEPSPPLPPEYPATPAPAQPQAPANHCVQHPSSPATAQCSSCGAYMCATCDFAFESGLHLCPACATKPRATLGKKRRAARMWSFILAAFSTLAFTILIVSAALNPEANEEMLGVFIMLFVFVPSVGGFGIGLGAIDRRFSNPGSLWAAVIWNGVILGGMLLLMVVGSMQ